ncbi:MAG: hypothetical protein DME24_08875 [Verrucomicrobia bacterium]|nr:MAG: hypothetical protein DME24_08875 [Verrucomicrobiota bacterium]
MAESYAHRWGQIIGDIFEQFVRDMLKSIAEKHGLYLDYKKAIAYLIEEEKTYRLREDAEQREMFEIVVRFNNGAKIEATFPTRQEAIGFLRTFEKS